MHKIPLTPVPHTKAWMAFEENLEGITHLVKLQSREIRALKANARRFTTYVKKCDLKTKKASAKLARVLERFAKTIQTTTVRFHTVILWQTVMLVTCVEAYMLDVLAAAASIDPVLMSKSEQRALYPEVIAAASLDALASDMRTRWARGWLSDGGPTRWISRLEKMGAKGYPSDLATRLELIWGIRHIVVHAAGIATTEFVKRHPGVVAAAGDRLRANNHDLKTFLQSMTDFMKPTEKFFLARYPSLHLTPTAT